MARQTRGEAENLRVLAQPRIDMALDHWSPAVQAGGFTMGDPYTANFQLNGFGAAAQALEVLGPVQALKHPEELVCIRLIETVCGASYSHTAQGEVKLLKGVAPHIIEIGGGQGRGVLIVDDLVDTGKTAKVVREIVPRAHLATVYAKPMGRPLVDTFITEVSQDTWIYFPWDTGLAFQPPINEGANR